MLACKGEVGQVRGVSRQGRSREHAQPPGVHGRSSFKVFGTAQLARSQLRKELDKMRELLELVLKTFCAPSYL